MRSLDQVKVMIAACVVVYVLGAFFSTGAFFKLVDEGISAENKEQGAVAVFFLWPFFWTYFFGQRFGSWLVRKKRNGG